MNNNLDSSTSVIRWTPINKSAIIRRIPIALLLTYFIWILIFAWSIQNQWSWSLERGLWWTSGGPGQFFPIPRVPGEMTVVTPGYLHDHIFYLLFMHFGIWIFWISLGFLFLSPYRINLRLLFVSIRSKFGIRRIS